MNNPELVASILKHGGKLLIVGGETKDLPRVFHEHPQILIWDDDQMNILNKEIPTNVKVIVYSRWISHTMVSRLNNAAKQLHAIKFPMLRPREIRELLAEIAQSEPKEVPMEELEQEIDQIIPVMEQEVEETTVPKTIAASGSVTKFVAKHLNIKIDYSVKGTIADEGRRLFKLAQSEGLKTTEGSITQAARQVIRGLGKPTNRPVTTRTAKTTVTRETTGDDFEELDKLIVDAIAAMKLVQEHLPKVRKETEKLRGMKQKFLKLLE